VFPKLLQALVGERKLPLLVVLRVQKRQLLMRLLRPWLLVLLGSPLLVALAAPPLMLLLKLLLLPTLP
jgi:hypothetical protein